MLYLRPRFLTMPRPIHWINVLLVAAAAGVVAIALVTVRTNRQLANVEGRLLQSEGTRAILLSFLSSMKDAEIGQRGYLITADESYLDRYYVGTDQLDAQLQELVQRETSSPPLSDHLAELVQLTRQKLADLAESIELRRTLPGNEGLLAAQNAVSTNRGRSLMVRIRTLIDDMTTAQGQQLAGLENEAADLRTTDSVLTALGLLLTLSAFVAAALATNVEQARRDRTEDTLMTERSRLKAIVDSAMDAVIVLDEEAQIQFMNPAAEDVFGYRDCDQVGQSLTTLFPQRLQQSALEQFHTFRLSDRQRNQLLLGETTCGQRADGQQFPAEAVISKSVVEGRPLFTIMLRDVGEREEGRKQIRELVTTLARVRDAIHLRDLDDKIQFWNAGAEELYGYTSEEVLGRPASEVIQSLSGDDEDTILSALQVDGVWNGEQEIPTRKGGSLIIESRRSLILNENGTPLSQLVIDTDITEEKHRRRAEQRSQRLESIGTLASGIAHDLNNVLTPITMGASLLNRAPDREDRKELIASIRSSAHRGAEMVRQLLSFAGGHTGQHRRVEVGPLVDETVSIVRHTFPKNITVSAHIEPDLAPVEGDATELSQVLMNLSINARDAMPGGGELSFEARNVSINRERPASAGDLHDGEYVQLTVADSGIGIPDDVIERVFDPFFTTKELGKGTGLGLSTCLGIVKGHGGTITVFSEPVSGTRFTIYLPSLTSHAAVDPSMEDQADQSGRGESLLMIDDEEAIVSVAAATLRAAGYDVVTAVGGTAGSERLRENPQRFALALVDLMMPQLDGAATIRELRQIRPDLPIIACSGLARPKDTDGTLAGCRAFLPKPYDDRRLLQTVRHVLDEVQAKPVKPRRQGQPTKVASMSGQEA